MEGLRPLPFLDNPQFCDRISPMKLIHFKPKRYGEEAFVCAESVNQAKEILRNQKFRNPPDEEYYRRVIEDMITNYSIEEHPVGEVVWTEIC